MGKKYNLTNVSTGLTSMVEKPIKGEFWPKFYNVTDESAA